MPLHGTVMSSCLRPAFHLTSICPAPWSQLAMKKVNVVNMASAVSIANMMTMRINLMARSSDATY
jgi:hypothetical protein